MRIGILLGPPGIGKGTQCALLSQRLGFKHISTGNLIRQEIASLTPVGIKVKALVEAGMLVDNDTILKCLESSLKSSSFSKTDVLLLDGIPRNLAQAEGLEVLLASEFKTKVDCVVALSADPNALVERFRKRATCSKCGHIESVPPSSPIALNSLKCSSCGTLGSLTRRKDDEPATVQKRFEIYEQETFPLVSYYRKRDALTTVNGLDKQEYVYARIAHTLIDRCF